MLVDVSTNEVPAGDSAQAILVARHANGNDLRMKLRLMADGTVHLAWSHVVSGNETVVREIVVKGLTYTAGDVLRLRFTAVGTAVAGTVWKVGTAEPATPQLQGTDTTAGVQSAGGVGVYGFLGGKVTNAPIALRFDNFSVTLG
jgi:hypothetical protein